MPMPDSSQERICSTICCGVPDSSCGDRACTQPESETEFGHLFCAAHEQLSARDRELFSLGRLVIELLATTRGSDPAGNLARLADIRRDAMVYELQASLAEQTAWAQRCAAERDEIIRRFEAAPVWPALKGTARLALGRLAQRLGIIRTSRPGRG